MKHNVAEFIGTIQDGGAETLVKDYALMLDKDRFNVVVIVFRRTRDSANDAILSAAGVRIVEIYKRSEWPFRVVQKLNRWWYVPYKLRKILAKEKIDVLHVHLLLLKYVSCIRRRIEHIRLFYTCHSEPYAVFGSGMSERSDRCAAVRLLRENALQIIALHDQMKDELNEMFGVCNTVTIRNGIDFRRFRDVSESRSEVRRMLGIPEDAFVLGHVGRFDKQKNHAFLLRVFQSVLEKEPEAYLLLVGAGQLENDVRKSIKHMGIGEHIVILSHRSDVPQLLRAMDVFVFPSSCEGLGIVLIEAQVAGVRCVVSDAVPEEAFQTDLAIPISLDEPVEKWRDVVLDRSARGHMNKCIEDYDMNKEIKRLEALYIGESVC